MSFDPATGQPVGALEVSSTDIVGAGGWVTGISIANDGHLLVRTDTYNGYDKEPGIDGRWSRQILPEINCDPDLIVQYVGGGGTFDVAIAPTDPDVRYCVIFGQVWVTQDAGATYAPSALPRIEECGPNQPNRMVGRALAVDPNNPAVCFFGSPDGLHYTRDYGATWTSVSTGDVPACGTDLNDDDRPIRRRMCVAFDPTSSVVGGLTQDVYVFVNGEGLFHSADAGATWAAVEAPTNYPTEAGHMKFDALGRLYLTGTDMKDVTTTFRRWDGEEWFEHPTFACKTLAISPHDPGLIYGVHNSGAMSVSLDYGVTWTDGGLAPLRVSRKIPWHAWTDEDWMSNGDIEFDPTADRLWMVCGIGVFFVDDPKTTVVGYSDTQSWTECSVGIENMVSVLLAVNEWGDLGYSCHDRGVMTLRREDLGVRFPAQHGSSTSFQHAGSVDYVPGSRGGWLGAVSNERGGSNLTAYSNDGLSWGGDRKIADYASFEGSYVPGGGIIVAFDENRWLRIFTNSNGEDPADERRNGIWRTADGGETWVLCTTGNNRALRYHFTYYVHSRRLVKCTFSAGTAYAYNPKTAQNEDEIACRGIWKTTDYGVTWSRVRSDPILTVGQDFWWGKFAQGGDANDWFWAGGDAAVGLMRSRDGMATWSQVAGTDDVNGECQFGEVFGVAMGPRAPWSELPTILVNGFRSISPASIPTTDEELGWWISYDDGDTWTLVARYIGGSYDLVSDLAADPFEFGRFYFGCTGSGAAMIQYQDKRSCS